MNLDDLSHEGYENLRVLPDGTTIGTQRMMFTTGLFVGLTLIGYRTRYCYAEEGAAVAACRTWDGKGDPPGLWIKQKPEDRMNPEWSLSA